MKINKLDEGIFDHAKSVLVYPNGLEIKKSPKTNTYKVYSKKRELTLPPSINKSDLNNIKNFLDNELGKEKGYSDWVNNNLVTEELSDNRYYRLEVGRDGKVLGGLFRYANTLMKQIDKMDPDYEDTYGDDVMDSIDKLDFDLKVPDVNWNGEDKEVVRCAFTQETFNKHKDTIDTLQTALEHFGYQLIKKEVQPDEDAIIYEDKDQIVYWDDMANIKPFLESFANHLDKDILEVIKDNKTTTNYVKQGKCFKTSGFNLLKAYKDPNTKDIKLYVGHLKPTNVDEEYTHIIAHMWIEVDGTIYATNEPKGFDRVVADTLTIDKDKDLYSQVENFLSKPSLNESLTESNNYGYHAGDLGKSEYYGSQSSSRGTGHFGTGTYFVGDPNRIKGYNDYNYGKGEAPHHIVDFSSYNLYKPSTNQKGYDLHDALKVLDGSYTYWKDKVDEVNIVKKYEAREKRNYDKFTEQELEELVGALNRLDSEEPLNYEYISNFLVPENFDKYYDELVLADLDTDGAFDDQYEVQEQLYDKVQEWTDWRVLNAVKDASNIENKLYQALEGRVSMSRIRQGLENVVKTEKQYEANRDKKVDSLATVFMKSLGYEGIDTRHLNKDDKEQALAGLDNTSYGSVIYDVKPNTIVESFEGKTFSLPKELVDKCIDYYKETYPTIKVDKLSVEQLVNDNDLLNDEDLQSYHQRQWDNKSAKEFSINQDKINSMRVSEVPFVVKKKDKLELVDGRHRTRALYNDGYDYVELPVVEEGLEEHYNFKSDYDNLVNIELQSLNKFLDKYGFEVEIVEDKDTLEDIDWENSVGMFLNSIQDDASIFPIALNKDYILKNVEDKTDLVYAIRGTLWHEAGHGVFEFLNDVYDLDDLDEEKVVEEFARYMEDSELYNILQQYINDDLEEHLGSKVNEEYANNIDKDILDTIKNPLDKLYKNTKCSKSAGTMLDYYFYETDKPLKLCLGAIRHKGDDSEPKSIAHVWVELDGKVRETNFPDGDYERVLVDELLIDRNEDLYNQVENFLNKTSLRECLQESLTESKVMSDRIKGLIDKAYDYCKQAGWDFSNPQTFKSQMLVNYPLKISLGNETAHRLGLAKYPVKGITEIVLAPQIDKFENDESILAVILHELGHIIAYDDDFAKGYVECSDKYNQAIVRSKAIKKKLSHHGKRWKDVVEKLSKVSGISLQRLANAEDTTEWNNINKDKYKYFFECPNCHCKLKYTRATDFVKTYDKVHPDGDPYWWCGICKKNTGNKIKFVKIDGGDYNG